MTRLALAVALMLVAAAARAAPESFKDCPSCPEMVVIPTGSATIGAGPTEIDRQAGDGPLRPVHIDYKLAFAKLETTRALYAQFVQETGYQTPSSCNYWDGNWGFVDEHDWRNPGYPQRPNHPVVCISWADGTAFAKWLSDKTGRIYRLPSSTEFEYAARGGTATPWFWGTKSADACKYANIADRQFRQLYPDREGFACEDGYRYTAPVGKFEPNPFGLHDMIGNAWEWTEDCWHPNFDKAPADGSAWLEADGGDCNFRTPRGGAFLSGIPWSRAASQSKDPATYRSMLTGFRVVTSDFKKPIAP